MPHYKNKFSLIELLIVFTILILLFSLLQPSLNNAIESSRTSLCLNNLKQFGIASDLFSEDHNFFVVPNRNEGKIWAQNLIYDLKYLPIHANHGYNHVTCCPSYEKKSIPNFHPVYGNGSEYFTTYSINLYNGDSLLYSLINQYPLQKVDDFESPSYKIYFMDGAGRNNSGSYVYLNSNYNDGIYNDALASGGEQLYHMHNDHSNVLFHDLHAESLHLDYLLDKGVKLIRPYVLW